MNVIKDRLFEHLDDARKENPNYFFIGLQGSQNYDLSYEGSDVDSKMLVLPSFEDFTLNRKPKSYTHLMPNEEHVDVKDIRLMFDCFWKQNINFLEILFSRWAIFNDEYSTEYEDLLKLRERIAHYNNYAAMNCMVGMAKEKFKALKHPYPATMEKIEKYGYDGKQLHHIMRMDEFMTAYREGYTFEECLTYYPKYGKDSLLRAKKNGYCLEYAEEMAASIIKRMDEEKAKYMAEVPLKVDYEVRAQAERIMVEVLKKNFRKEL